MLTAALPDARSPRRARTWLRAALLAGIVAGACPAVAQAQVSAQGTSDAAVADACSPQWQLSTNSSGASVYNGIWCGSWTVSPDSTNPFSANDFGQCTYWAAEMRPDIWTNRSSTDADPSDWNAATWPAHAADEGLTVSSTPAPGDIAVWTPSQAGNAGGPGHVAYVQNVIGSTIVVTEMNARFGTSGGDTTLLTDTPVSSGYGWQGLQFISEPAGTTVTPPATLSLPMSQGAPSAWVDGTTATVQLPVVPGSGNATVTAVAAPAAASPTTTTTVTGPTTAPAASTGVRAPKRRAHHRHRRRAARSLQRRRSDHAGRSRSPSHVLHRSVRAALPPAGTADHGASEALAAPHVATSTSPVTFTEQTAAPWEQFTAALTPGTWTVTVTYQSAGAPFTSPAAQTFTLDVS